MDSNEALNPEDNMLSHWSPGNSPEEAIDHFVQCDFDVEKIFPSLLRQNDGISFLKQLDAIISSNRDDSCTLRLLKAVSSKHSVKRLIKITSSVDATDYMNVTHVASNIVRIVEAIYAREPNLSIRTNSLLNTVDVLLDRALNNTGRSEKGSIERLQHFRDEVQNLQKNISIFSLESFGHANDEMMPPEDFRSIPIFPSEEDIFISGDGKPFLRKNITRGSYADPDHYLDVQFRLLREDCISQMRKGIQEYIQKKEATPKSNSFRLQEARLYNIAQIVNSEMSPQGKLYVVQLDSNKAKSISWNKTSRLKYGSLICLSPDDFKTLYFGVVVENDGLNKDHTFKVQIAQKDGRQIPVFGNLRIIESTAYFENYRHSLRYLQEIEYGELPFERYIVQCQREIKVPAYLEPGNSTFDFSSNITGSNIYDFTGNSKGDLFQYDILKDEWPTAKQLKMDDSQYRAFKSALRQEFSIIQGPPGTGKTYLTLQIAKSLLRNQSLWNSDDGSAQSETHPMVVVCLTNHALDKFMEGILDFMRPDDMQADQCGIVRVGSRCQNEAIEQFSLKNHRGKHSKYRNNQRNRNEIQRIYQQILETKYCLNESREGIVSTKELSSVLDTDIPFRNPHVMHRWLGVSERSWMNMVRRFLLETNALQLNEGHHTRSGVDETDEKSSDKSEQKDIDFFEIKRVENSTYILNLHRQMKNLMTKYSRKLPKYAKTYLLNVLSENIKCINQGSSITKQRVSEITAHRNQIWKISKATRWNLYRFWLRKWRESKQEELSLLQEELEKTIHVYESTKKEIDSDILKESRVIAMTITGASKNQDIMSRVGPRILIVEEAAETLEAQVISALSPSCQQIILVGDHKQLEPQPAVFELAQKYNLSLSLFHRMIKNGLPFNVLKNQHRMRPGISKLVRPIYKTLYDSPEVFCYPDVEGIKQNIYFFNHCLEETLTDESTSYSNPFEAHFVKGLCKYLLARGHESSQITVLTPYSKQMFAIRDIMPWHEFGINTTCLDRFQGDENDIIILSLVRSNQEGNIGFLGKENRACVALSRAKIGLYVVGNIDQLCRYSKTDIWRRTARKLTGTCLGSNLPLDNICMRHFGFDSLICCAEDFNTVQMGTGCNNPCGEPLPCGHVCRLTCHDIDSVEHHCLRLCLKICQNGHTCERFCHDQSPCFCESLVTTKLVCGHEMTELCHVQQEKEPGHLINTIPCQLICQVTCENGHLCSKKCHYPQPCLCPVETEKILSCGHKAIAICNEDPGSKDCSKIIEKELKCGHRIRDKCSSDLSQYQCMENVTKTLGKCGHEAEMSCSQNPSEFRCTKVVKRKLQCDHIVEMECHLRSEEYKCQIMILNKFECGHESSFPCYMRGKDNKCTAFVTEQREKCHHLHTRECWERNEIASSACEEPKLMKRSECNHFFTVTCHNFTKSSSLSKSEKEEFIRKLESEAGPCKEEFKIGFPCKHDLQSVTCSQLRTAGCKQVCGQLCSNDHRCEKICHYPDECECETPILIQLPECGHWTKVPCSKSKELSKTCSRMSGTLFPECHQLIKVRHPTHRYAVTVPCPQKERLLKLFTQNRRYGRFPSNLKLNRDCGHFEKTDYFDPKLSGCNSECKKTLACGHVCRNTCDRCLPGELHAQCYSSCGNTLICGHNCKSDICGSCKLCDMDCEHMCTHMKCELKCSMPCQRCTEPCHWSCPHHKCSNMCGEVCNRPRCNIRCERKLPCGHTCSGFCGDPCPEPCRFCNVEELKKLTTVDVENAVFIQLECTHIFESGMLDLELDKQWRLIQRIHCPRCRTAIKTHPRYTDIRNSVFSFRENIKLQLLYMSQRLGIEKVPFSSPHCSEYRNFVEKFGIFLVQTEEIWKLTNRNAYEIIDNLHDEVSQFLEEKTRFSPKVQQSIDIYHAFLKMDVFWQYGIVVCAHLKLDTPFTLYGTTDLCEEEADDEIPDVKVDKKISELGEKVLSFISKYSLRTDLFSDLSSELKEALSEVEESQATCPLTKACSTPQRPYVLDPHARHWTICNKGHIFSKVMNEEECYLCHDIDFYSEVEVFRREGMSVTLDARRPGIIKVQANITAKGGNEVQTIEKRGDQNLTSTLHGVKNENQQDRNINVEVPEDVDQINDKTIRQREELSTTPVYNNTLYGRSSSCDRRTSFSKTLQEFGRVSSADNVAACIKESNSVSNGRDQLYRGETRQNGESKTIVGRRNHLSSEDLRRKCMENLKRRKENEIFLKQNNLPKSKTNVTKKDFDGSIRASSCDRSANVWNRFDTLRRVCSAEDLTNQTSNGKGKSENEIYSSETTTDESESKDGVNEQDEAWVKVETRRRKRHQDKIEAKYNNQQEERSGRKRHKKRFQRKSNKKEGKPDDRTKDGLSKHDLNKTTDYNLINSPVAFTMAEFPPLSAQCNVKVKETKSDKESTSMPCKVDPIHNKKAQTDIFGEPRNFIEKKNKIEHADEIKMPETPNLQTAQMCSNPFDMNEKKCDENIGSFGLEVKDEGMRHRSSSWGGTANPSGRNTMQTKNETHGQTSSGLRNLEEYKVHVSKRILEGDVEGTSIISTRSSTQESLNKMKLEESCRMDSSETAIQNKGNTGTEDNNGQKVFDWQSSIPVKNITRRRNRSTSLDLRRKVIQNLQGNYEREQSNSTSRKSFPSKSDRSQNYCKHTEFDRKTLSGGCEGKNLDTSTRVFSADHMKRLLNQEESKPVKPNAAQTVVGSATGGTDKIKRVEQSPVTVKRRMKQREKLTLIAVNTLGRQSTMRSESKNIEAECKLEPNVNSSCQSSDLQEFLGAPIVESWDSSDSC